MSKCWVARCEFLDITFDKKFDNVRDCIDYIDKDLIIINYLLGRLYYQLFIIDNKKYPLLFKDNFIFPYHLSQKRFADGFDF